MDDIIKTLMEIESTSLNVSRSNILFEDCVKLIVTAFKNGRLDAMQEILLRKKAIDSVKDQDESKDTIKK